MVFIRVHLDNLLKTTRMSLDLKQFHFPIFFYEVLNNEGHVRGYTNKLINKSQLINKVVYISYLIKG